MQDLSTAAADAAIAEIQEWLLTTGRVQGSLTVFTGAFAEFLSRHVPLDRLVNGKCLLHPQVSAYSFKWERKASLVTQVSIPRPVFASWFELMRQEPFVRLEAGEKEVRLRNVEHAVQGLPEKGWDWYIQDGYTDYLALHDKASNVLFGDVAFGTRAQGGFTRHHICILKGIVKVMFAIVHIHSKDLVLKSLLCTYLGQDPGSRVHQGDIARGDVTSVTSVIWFSDIRGYTKLSAEYDSSVVIGLVNEVFEHTATIVRKYGGEILKMLGDGVMAAFYLREHEDGISNAKEVCRRARVAAKELQDELILFRKSKKSKGLPSISLGIGLHFGECSYGNVGSSDRLDFTLIGPCVNLASRVERLCAQLTAEVLASDAFVALDAENAHFWKSRGSHSVKGVDEPVTVFELIA